MHAMQLPLLENCLAGILKRHLKFPHSKVMYCVEQVFVRGTQCTGWPQKLWCWENCTILSLSWWRSSRDRDKTPLQDATVNKGVASAGKINNYRLLANRRCNNFRVPWQVMIDWAIDFNPPTPAVNTSSDKLGNFLTKKQYFEKYLTESCCSCYV